MFFSITWGKRAKMGGKERNPNQPFKDATRRKSYKWQCSQKRLWVRGVTSEELKISVGESYFFGLYMQVW